MIRLIPHYSVSDEELDSLDRIRKLVHKAERILTVCHDCGSVRQEEELMVDVELTHYNDEEFGIRIYLGKNRWMDLENIQDVKSIYSGPGWTGVCFQNNESIQFVFKNGLVPPRLLPTG